MKDTFWTTGCLVMAFVCFVLIVAQVIDYADGVLFAIFFLLVYLVLREWQTPKVIFIEEESE